MCLRRATENGRCDVANVLIAAGADVNKRVPLYAADVNRRLPLYVAAVYNQPKIAALFIERGANVNQTTATGDTALLLSARSNQTGFVSLLIEHGADVNAANEQGRSPTWFAAALGHTDILKKLILAKADVNKTDNYGTSPLDRAIAGKRVDEVDWLLQAGAVIKEDMVIQELSTAAEIKKMLVNAKKQRDPEPKLKQGVLIDTAADGTVTVYKPIASGKTLDEAIANLNNLEQAISLDDSYGSVIDKERAKRAFEGIQERIEDAKARGDVQSRQIWETCLGCHMMHRFCGQKMFAF